MDALLIDLSSPVEYRGDEEEGKDLEWKQRMDEEHEEDFDMMLSFSQLAQRGSPLAMLRRLPPDASSLGVAAFAPSPSLYSSPGGSPVRAGCLTPSKLCTPIGSPLARPSTLATDRI